jgi:hypothetical protein
MIGKSQNYSKSNYLIPEFGENNFTKNYAPSIMKTKEEQQTLT